MKKWMTFLLWLTLFGLAEAQPLTLTWDGSALSHDTPRQLQVSSGAFTVITPCWVTASPLTGRGPATVTFRAAPQKLAFGKTTTSAGSLVVDGQSMPITFTGKCSTSSPCDRACSSQPLPTRTPVPGATGQPTRTAAPDATAQPTVVPSPQPTAGDIPLGFRLPPLRPTATDVNFAVLDEGYPFQWCPIRQPAGGAFVGYVPATQTCMDAMTEASLQYMLKTVRVVRQVNGGTNTADFCLSDSQGASAITAFLNPVYEGNFGEYKGDWGEDWSGKDYSKPHYCQKKARYFLLQNPIACAATVEHDVVFEWLQIAVVGGKCMDAYVPVSFPETKIDKSFKDIGMITYDVKQPPLTSQQLTLLHETHRCHAESTVEKCGGPKASCSAGAAHLAFEASARNETEHHFFVMKRFFNDPDLRRTPAEICSLAKLEDKDHMLWMQKVEAGDWKSRKTENDHGNAHNCMVVDDPSLKIRRTDCGDPNVNKCLVETCDQLLARIP